MKSNLWSTIEGKILLLGILLSGILLGYIGFYVAVDPGTAKVLALAFIAHTIGGRAAGIGLCILNEFGPVLTIGYNFYLEILIVCFTYSGFILSTTNYLKIEWVSRFMGRLAFKAMEQKEKVASYGWIGIFLFVMAPLPVTGPVVGSIIGYMIRLGVVRNFSATFLGTFTAIGIWYLCFDFLEQRFHMIQYIFAAIVLMILIPYLRRIKRFIAYLIKKEPDDLG